MRIVAFIFLIAAAVLPDPFGHGAFAQGGSSNAWKDAFPVDKQELKSVGRNPYFILEPGYRLVLGAGKDSLVITVLDETKVVDAVTTRVVEERETSAGRLVEVSRNCFAIDPRTGDVYYFGEDVDMYKSGKIVGHGGSWRSGERKAHFGLMMPGTAKKGDMYYQELAPGAAMDRARIVSVSESIKTPAGTFSGCVKTEETTPLEPGAMEYKIHAPGIGLVRDGGMTLVRYGTIEPGR